MINEILELQLAQITNQQIEITLLDSSDDKSVSLILTWTAYNQGKLVFPAKIKN